MKERHKEVIKEYTKTIIIAILIALFIRTFIVQAFKIPSGSMKETLLIGDHILVNKFIYGVKIPLVRKTLIPVSEPGRGDVVVFIYPMDRSKDFIKRVMAVAGDTIEIRDKKIFINGTHYEDGHGVYKDTLIQPRSLQPRDNFGPVRVPDGHIFVMGDNRDQSYDSRFWGFVNLEDVLGKAFIIYWSWNKKAGSVRWDRIGDIIR
ncbi:MAG: signal peptidase I [Syntrophales bacterium]|jgi:signal peptidase I|nr:signal peptidase I [Syntrophales bacterium]MDY0043932.1 signal peptidase I [Syntrophales bacterium]